MPVKVSEWWPYIQQPLDEKWGYIWGTGGVMWTRARQNQVIANYEADPVQYKNYKQAAAYGAKWIGRYVIDCSGMPYRAFKKFGISIPHGSNSIWSRYLSEKGKLTYDIIKTLKKGAAIFTGTDSDKPHIGTYDGEGYVIEASSTTAGVIRTAITNSKWKYYGYYKDLIYDVEVGEKDPVVVKPIETTIEFPTLRRGDKGEYVTLLQTQLIARRYSLPKYGADGDFGKETEAAVKQFQKDWGLKEDGVVGPDTWKALTNSPTYEPKKSYQVTIVHLTEEQADALLKQYPNATKTEE